MLREIGTQNKFISKAIIPNKLCNGYRIAPLIVEILSIILSNFQIKFIFHNFICVSKLFTIPSTMRIKFMNAKRCVNEYFFFAFSDDDYARKVVVIPVIFKCKTYEILSDNELVFLLSFQWYSSYMHVDMYLGYSSIGSFFCWFCFWDFFLYERHEKLNRYF